MANILFLVHRLPFPPNKGDKVRSFHLLKHLAARHRVFLGTFVDDPDDLQHIETVRSFCSGLYIARLEPKFAKLRSLNALLADDPLTLRYYRDAGLQGWVENTCRSQKIDAAVIFSSAMAQYVESIPRLQTVVDFVDVDSAKWTQYAPNHRWPMSLLAYEREVATRSARSFFVTVAEVELFNRLAPECAVRVEPVCNGVDADYFAPDESRASPFSVDETPIVFTGAMDYLPNIDAVRWFVSEMMQALLEKRPQLRFYIVGRSPTPEVLALAGENVIVTGTVPDVRPYLQHAAVVVAPLRIARGIQNKIIASTECAAAVDAEFGTELKTATTPTDFVTEIDALLRDPECCPNIGRAARRRVIAQYSWEAHLAKIDHYLPAAQ